MAGRIVNADVLDALRQLPKGLFHMVCTSPPYWGLRDYGLPPRHWSDGSVCCYGLEPTPELFVAHSVEIFREVRRVLRDDGCLWLNIGDSYATGPTGTKANGTGFGAIFDGRDMSGVRESGVFNKLAATGLKPGDQCLIPHRVALALQADGWYLRSTIVWAKKSPMPESISGWRWVRCRVKVAKQDPRIHQDDAIAGRRCATGRSMDDMNRLGMLTKWQACPGCPKCEPNNGYVLRRGKWRPTTAHEYIFLLSKSERYFCDGEAVAEPVADPNRSGSGNKTKSWGNNESAVRANGTGEVERCSGIPWENCETRNPRSVWSLSNEPFKGAHFATFPTAIPRRAIEASTSKAGCCPACGSQYAPVVESERVATRPGENTKVNGDGALAEGNRDPHRHVAVTRVTGYRATCSCPPAESVPCRVLEPFLGSGTTCQVAEHLGRDWLGIEASSAYVEIAERRIKTPLRSKKVNGKRVKPMASQPLLF